MPEREFITGIAGAKVFDIVRGNSFEINGIGQIQQDTVCPGCGSKLFRIKATKQR